MIKVLIVGSGVAGLALLAALQRLLPDRIQVRLIERDVGMESRHQGYSLTIQRNGMAVLEALGLDGKAKAYRSRCRSNMTFSAQGKALVSSSSALKPRKTSNVPIPRQHVRSLLLSAVQDPSAISWGVSLKDFSVGEGVVRCVLSDGEELECDLLVGCDGVHSQVRKKISGQEAQYLGVYAINGIGSYGREHASMLEDRVFQVLDGTQRVFVKPFLEGQSMWQLTFPVEHNFDEENKLRSWIQDGRRDLMLAEARDRMQAFSHPGLQQLLGSTPVNLVRMGPLYDVVPPQITEWVTSRVVLLGDAAHSMSPFKGQGANNAIVDAWHLAKSIEEFLSDEDQGESAFLGRIRAFEQEMFDRSRKYVLASREAVTFYHQPKCLEHESLTKFMGRQ